MGPIFQDRFDAGRFLARHLSHYAGDPAVLALGLPRGGVPVAYEIAREIQARLDVFLVRKLGVPGHEELAMGAIASGGVRVLNEDVVSRLRIPRRAIEAAVEDQTTELERRERVYRGERRPLDLVGRRVILVDDGLATGASMRAAVRALRSREPASICVAVPVGAAEACELLRPEVDDVVCGQTPEPFFAVGTWYSNFIQVTDDEVRELLERAAREISARPIRDERSFAG